jgi:hypothetical protein
MSKKIFFCLWIGLVLFYLFLTGPSLFSTHHILYNLEPYPDGLLYIQPAMNLAAGMKFALIHESYSLLAWVPPLYSLFLIPFYLVSHQPQFFYLTNILLGIGSISFLYAFMKNCTKSTWASFLTASLYVLHGYILWLPTVPMAENLSLFLICSGLWVVTTAKLDKKKILWAAFVIAGLVFTKYVLALLSFAFFLYLSFRLLKEKKLPYLGSLMGLLIVGAGVFFFYQVKMIHFNPTGAFKPLTETKTERTFSAFSRDYFGLNVRFYLASLLGQKTKFLWLDYSFTSAITFLVAFASGAYLVMKKKYLKEVLLVIALALFSLLVVIFFYTPDTRYIIPFIPTLCILIGFCFAEIEKEKKFHQKNLLVGVIFGLLLLQVISQVSFLKFIITTNLLHRSRAWQYESILSFNEYFAQKPDSYLVTVMPPFLVDLYSNHSYILLPLSTRQEFMNQGQRTWGELDYANLINEYQKLLREGKKVYVTNAYLSSQHEFEPEYQQIENTFTLEKVKEDCLGTCNLWELQLKPEQIKLQQK